MSTTTTANGWALEVVRGKDTGRRYALRPGEMVLGSKPGGPSAIDLADQEADSPRRMAPQQAKIECRTQGVTLTDLESPGGTFVNRQRILPGQARALQGGDVIQVGAVQLKVVADAAPATPSASSPPAAAKPSAPQPPPLPTPSRPSPPPVSAQFAKTGAFLFNLKSGATCRSWDDFLTISAQRWSDLRDELISGRLAAFLASIGRSELSPDPNLPGTPDERLDAWLGRVPASRTAQPELNVHPATLVVRVAAGGGITRRKLVINNTGHRLLRATARVEPAATTWLKIAPEFASKSFVTVEETELPLEIATPDVYRGSLTASVVIESNCGTQRIGVVLEPPVGPDDIPVGPAAPTPRAEWGLADWVARQPSQLRFVACTVIGFLGRLALGIASALFASDGPRPGLLGPVLLWAVLGALLGLWVARSRGERRDWLACGFAGAIAGILVAALFVAACRSIEPLLGAALSGWLLVDAALWAGIGVAFAGSSLWLLPVKGTKGSAI
jgi:hypothetical protein